MKGSGAPFSVGTLDKARHLPWRARGRLRGVRRNGRTGVLLIAEIREPVRSFTDRAGVVSVRENGLKICSRDRFATAPKFVDVPPGLHDMQFTVRRWRASRTSSFRRTVELREGDVLVALCDPVQPNTFYRKSPSMDSWIVGIISAGEDASDSFKTRRPPPPTVAP
ncbi:hypothetical protein [Streptomyces sp. MBT53]|uniref:hypothetical protein n=1 Tax=Streptomyces sp. MBT53 TaxID=1488384 RepID=UPI00191348B2|nr:hypothetical protein [Streptomyces sp. MBT53]MBK6011636.1 hypothetical protein [Streptomyces sp. MBT53]